MQGRWFTREEVFGMGDEGEQAQVLISVLRAERDTLLNRVAALEADRDRARAVADSLAARCHSQSELLAHKADRLPRLRVLYRNHRGETAVRTITVLAVRFGTAPPWHAAPQPLVEAFDHEKEEHRTFALGNIINWGVS